MKKHFHLTMILLLVGLRSFAQQGNNASSKDIVLFNVTVNEAYKLF